MIARIQFSLFNPSLHRFGELANHDWFG